jgi:chorismate lyase
MTARYLSAEDLRELDRDLQILIATNGTLTRILEIVTGEKIAVKVIDQQTGQFAPQVSGHDDSPPVGKTMRRQVLLTGGTSGVPFVAAESFIAIDYLPSMIATTLMETNHPLGEIVMANCLETFKDAAQVWVASIPNWIRMVHDVDPRSTAYARRYRMIAGGKPVMSICEFFLIDTF